MLQSRAIEHRISSQALLDAKNELLALRRTVHDRDEQLTVLNDAIHQRDDAIEQLVQRLDAANRDYAQAHEDSRCLRDRLRHTEQTLEQERLDYNNMLTKLRSKSEMVEQESAKLTLERLHSDFNEQLRRRDAEHAVVVTRLMADVESARRKVGSARITGSSSGITFTKEEHEADLEQQLSALRAELDEIYGEDINRMKEQMRERHASEIERLERELRTSVSERDRYSGQVNMWQQQYVLLSQQNVSSIDIAQQLSDAVADSIKQRQLIAELSNQVA